LADGRGEIAGQDLRQVEFVKNDETPVVMVATQEDPKTTAAGLSDWLIMPFTISLCPKPRYARGF
jgi:hypothetical protein